jgi:hypothetical protein
MTREMLTALFEYRDGALYWKSDRGSNKVLNRRAGSPNGEGYIQVKIDGVLYKAHRLIWIIHNGAVPDGYVLDHINGSTSDNRIENLRIATRQQNNCNSRTRVDNSSGVKGVSWHKPSAKWIAQIQHAKRKIHVGLFDSLDAAAQAVYLKRLEIHDTFSRME